MLVRIPAALLPANAAGERMEDDPSAWVPVPRGGLRAPGPWAWPGPAPAVGDMGK